MPQFFDCTEPIFLRRSLWTLSGLPEFISEDSHVPLAGFLSGHNDTRLGLSPPMRLQ